MSDIENMVNKRELARFIAKRRGITIKDASAAVDDVFESLEELFIDHKSVNIQGFGKFITMKSKPKSVQDFINGKTVTQEPVWKTAFLLSDNIKLEVRDGRKYI